jgi:hypothetical protein
MKPYGVRQPQAFHLLARPKGIALALHHKHRALQVLEMRCAQRVRLLGRVKRIAQARQAKDAVLVEELVGDEASDPSAHRLAANQKGLIAGHPVGGGAIFVHEALRARRRPARSGLPAGRHVRKFEAVGGDAAFGQQAGDGFQERRIHAGASTVGAKEPGNCLIGLGNGKNGALLSLFAERFRPS